MPQAFLSRGLFTAYHQTFLQVAAEIYLRPRPIEVAASGPHPGPSSPAPPNSGIESLIYPPQGRCLDCLTQNSQGLEIEVQSVSCGLVVPVPVCSSRAPSCK